MSSLCFCVVVLFIAGVQGASVDSVKAFKSSLKWEQSGGTCFKILTSEDGYGCENLDAKTDAAPIQFIDRPDVTLHGDRVVAMPVKILVDYLNRYETHPDMQTGVVAILALPASDDFGFSSGALFPNAGFPNASFPYADKTHEWNPTGTGLRYKHFSIPIILIDPELVDIIREGAQRNDDKGFSGPLLHAEVDVRMEAQENSVQCIENEQCLPIGGHSVVGILPGLHSKQQPTASETILVMTAMDTAGFFLDRVQGADSSVSGLIAMLSALHLLSNKGDSESYKHRLAFGALSGEPWDYMGSRRMIVELTPGEHSVFNEDPPLELASISKIVEIGQIGRPKQSESRSQFYLHANDKSPRQTVKDAFLDIAQNSNLAADIQAASEKNPGLPPSSLMTWLTIDASIDAVVLAEYNEHFINQRYEGLGDNASQLDVNAITQATLLLTKTLYRLATEDDTILEVDVVETEQIVKSLMDCSIGDTPGLECTLAQDLISVDSRFTIGNSDVEHYASVLRINDFKQQESLLDSKNNLARFIFNYMGRRIKTTLGDSDPCDFEKLKCDAENGEVCIGHRVLLGGSRARGRCLQSSVYYVPSYSLSLRFISCENDISPCGWQVDVTSALASNAIAEKYGWSPDRIWTESNWGVNSQETSIFIQESNATDMRLFLAGLSTTVATLISTLVVRSVWDRRMRQ